MQMTLGEKLIKYRKIFKMTQDEVAEILKVTRQTISNWELNQTSPDLEQAKHLSKLYKISLDELIDNNVKEVLTEKISNTEKLAGLIYKILKWFIIFLIGSIVLMIIGVILFSTAKRSNEVKTTVEINCGLNGKKYSYSVAYDANNRIITAGGDAYLDNVLDLSKYEYADQVIDKVKSYFETNGGSCK